MQLERRAAVLLVVALDLLEDRVVAGLDPLLEAHDRLVAARHLGGALEPVELLDRLDRVAVGRGPQRLLDDAVEVDQHLLAQEVVDLLLPRSVLAGEAGQGRALVRGVVVDVQARVLRDAARRPSRRTARTRCARHRGLSPTPRRRRPRRRRCGSSSRRGTRARARSRRTGGPPCRTRRRPRRARAAAGSRAPLRRGGARTGSGLRAALAAAARPGGGRLRRSRRWRPAEAGIPGSPVARSPSSSSVVIARGNQRLGLRAPHARDEREVVVVDALLPAHVPEVADPAVAASASRRSRARPPPRRGTARGRGGSTPRTRPPGTSRARRARSRRERARPAARDPRHLLGVEQQLQHVRRLGAARELRVDGLVAAVGLLLEEVAEAAPASRRSRYGW